MRIQKSLVRRGVLAGAAVLAISGVVAWVHAGTAQAAASQGSRVTPRVTEAVDEAQRVVLRGNVHPKARAEFDRGPVSDAQPITKMLLLLQRSPEQEAELRQLMEGQQSKNSANFHAWLTPEEFGRRFGPADEDVQAVTDWLASHGFQGIHVSKGKITVQFAGNVGQVRRAFSTEIHRYNVRGEEHFANASDPQIPVALAPVVRGLAALHNFRLRPMLRNIGSFQRTASGEIRPLFTYTDSNGQFFAMGPADFAKIYNVPPAMTGAGQTIAVVARSNIKIQDVRDFRSMFGLPANDPNVILNGPDPGLLPGEETEADLDAEWSGAVAPAATIDFVVTESTETDAVDGVDGSAMYIVDNNIAPILSESFSSCELNTGESALTNSLWQQAAAQGISVVVAAGDNGSAGCDPGPTNQDASTLGPAVSGTASTPFNTALGGTDFDDAGKQSTFWSTTNSTTATPPAIPASALGYIPERTWNDSCAQGGSTTACTAAIVNGNQNSGIDLVAGSGGHSALYAKPTWQAGFGTGSARDLPDVSLFSSDGGPTSAPSKSFYIICESDQDPTGGSGCDLNTNVANANHNFQAVGGTSAATPAFAGIMALVLQQQVGQRQGVANYVLYNLAKTAANVCVSAANPAATCIFYDVQKGNNSVACVGGSPSCSNTSTGANQFGILATSAGGNTPAFNATAGYDLATGLGSVNVGNLVTNWASGIPAFTASSVTLNALPASITLGQSVTISGAVSPGTATGIVLLENAATGAVIGATSGTDSVGSGGSYSFATTLLPAGSYNVIAHYGGDGTFAGNSSAPQAVSIAQQGSKLLVDFVTFNANNVATQNTASASVTYGSPYIVRVDVTNTNGAACQNSSTGAVAFACPTGSISLFQGAGATNPLSDFNGSNTARLNDRGFAEDQPIQLSPGSYSLNATFAADASSSLSSSSTSNTVAVTVTHASTTAAVAASPTSIAAGGTVTLTATVNTTSNGAGPTGTVQFKNGSSNLGNAVSCTPTSGAASSSGTASCTATLSTTLSQMVPMARPRVRSWPQVPVVIVLLLMVMLATYVAARRAPASTRLRYAAAGLILFACVAAGIAGCSGGGGSGGGGSHADSITATYSGDANYTGSTSAAVTVTVQ